MGKTSLAVHLAGAYAEKHGRVLPVDIDPQHSINSTLIDDVYDLESKDRVRGAQFNSPLRFTAGHRHVFIWSWKTPPSGRG